MMSICKDELCWLKVELELYERGGILMDNIVLIWPRDLRLGVFGFNFIPWTRS